MISFGQYIENKIRRKFEKAVDYISELFVTLEINNKPTLEFNYNPKKLIDCAGLYCDPTNKTSPNHIIINLPKIKNVETVAIVLCHELGHWYHVNKERNDFIRLKSIIENSKDNDYYYAKTELENIADEYGKLFANYFGCEKEYIVHTVEKKKEREEIDKEYLEMLEYYKNKESTRN